MVTKIRAFYLRNKAQKKLATMKNGAKRINKLIRGFISRCYAKRRKFTLKILVFWIIFIF